MTNAKRSAPSIRRFLIPGFRFSIALSALQRRDVALRQSQLACLEQTAHDLADAAVFALAHDGSVNAGDRPTHGARPDLHRGGRRFPWTGRPSASSGAVARPPGRA